MQCFVDIRISASIIPDEFKLSKKGFYTNE